MVGKHCVGGLLGRVVAERVNAASRRSRVIQLAQIPIVVPSASIDPSSASKGPTFTKAGVVISLVAYVLLALLLAVTLRDLGEVPSGERRLYWVLVVAVTFLV
jgi:hypothetical protein